MAQEGGSTALDISNFTSINSDCGGHYHLMNGTHLLKLAITNQMPFCNGTSFHGSLKGEGYTLRTYRPKPLFDTLENAEFEGEMICFGWLDKDLPEREAPIGLLANRLSGNNTIHLTSGWPMIGAQNAPSRAVVGFVGLVKDGHHTLQQSNAFLDITKEGVAGGGVSLVQGGTTTLIQTDCLIRFLGRYPSPANTGSIVNGGGVAQLTAGKLILSQTDLCITEPEKVLDNSLTGGGIGEISGESAAVLTQTQVWSNLYEAADGPTKNRAATFGSLAKNATVTLRLFSGLVSGNACGSIESDPAVTVNGVIDTASYLANSTSCKTGNHSHSALKRLDTTQPQDWRQAHQEFCCSQFEKSVQISCAPDSTSCHYPHELLLATVPMDENAVLVLSRQHHLPPASVEHGLLRVSRLLLNNLNADNSAAELDRSFGIDGTLLFKPGEHHRQLQPEHMLLALVDDQNLTLLCRTDANTYQLGTLSLRSDPSNNATVAMLPLEGLKGEPALLTLNQSGQGCHLWTHEQQNHTIYRYSLTDGCGPPTGAPHLLHSEDCLLYTSPSPRDRQKSRMPSSA